MRRHWITTFLAGLCFATAAALLYSICLLLLEPDGTQNAPLYIPIWRILGLFPLPTSFSWVVSFVVSHITPALVHSKTYSAVLDTVGLLFSIVLGVAILQMRTWARYALVAICALTAVLETFTLFQIVSFSRDFLTVLGSNYRQGTVARPGVCLASLAISITLLRLLLRDGLPAVAPTESPVGSPTGADLQPPSSDARLMRTNKFVVLGTASVIVLELIFMLNLGSSGGSGQGFFILLLLVMLVPHAVILIRSRRGPDRFSLGLATGYALLITYIGGIFLPNFLLAWMWVAYSPKRASDWLFLLLEFVPLIQFFIFVSAVVTSRHIPSARPKSAQVGLWGLAFLIPLVVGTAGPQFFFEWQQGLLRVPGIKSSGDEYKDLQRREVIARELVHSFGKCAFFYAQSHPEVGFPENATLMGPNGTKCLSRVEVLGQPEGYSFHYEPSKSPTSARFDRFTVAAQLNNQHHYEAALMDEKGIFAVGNSNKEQPQMVTADQISWNSPGIYKRPWNNMPARMFPRIQSCAALLHKQSPDSEFPATLAAVLSVKENPQDPDCLRVYRSGPDPILQAAANSNQVEDHGYILEYGPERDASGKISHFHVTLRPKRYIEDGIRSYYMDDSGVVRATPEDRQATAADPEALPCETGDVCGDG